MNDFERLELDPANRRRVVENLRADLARVKAEDVGGMDASQMCRRIGYLESIADGLLRVIDGPPVDDAVDGPETASEGSGDPGGPNGRQTAA